MKKALLILTVLVAFLLALCACAEETNTGNMLVVNVSEWVSLRELPDKKATALIQVPKGAIVRNASVYNNDFHYAEYDNYAGYILSEYLIPSDGVCTFDKMKVVNCKQYVTLRSLPSKSADEIMKVPLNEVVTDCVSVTGDFTLVSYAGTRGFILTQYLIEVEEDGGYVSARLGKQQVVNCAEWVSLRRAPDQKATRTLRVPLGATVTNCIRVSETFAYAEYKGKSGFILYKYLTKPAKVLINCAAGDMEIVNCTSWVSLREKPDTSSARLAKVPLGTLLNDCVIYSDEFIKAKYAGKTGYIAINYTAVSLYGKETKMMQVYNCSEWVTLRSLPSSKAKSLENIPLGAVVKCWSTDFGGFFLSEYNGRQGYISSAYLTEYFASDYSQGAYTQLAYARNMLSYNQAPAGVYLVATGINTQYPLSESGAYYQLILNRADDEWRSLVSETAEKRLLEIEGGTELYLVIPADENVYVKISGLDIYNADAYGNLPSQTIFEIDDGAPFLIRCNATEIYADCELIIIPAGSAALTWHPQISGENGHIVTKTNSTDIYDFTRYVWAY